MRPCFLASFALLICAAAADAQQGAPPERLSISETIEADSGGRSVWVRNNTALPVTITGIVITRCDNLRQTCGEHPATLVVLPGKSKLAFRLERLDPRQAWGWSYRIETKQDAPDRLAPPPGAPRMMALMSGTPVPLKMIPVDSFHALVDPIESNGSCGQVRVPDLPEGHQALVMVFGTAVQPAARSVVVRYNGSGIAYDYVDSRVDLLSDTMQTIIQLDLVRETGMLRNMRGGMPEMFRVTGAQLIDAASLGRPSALIARVLKECGT